MKNAGSYIGPYKNAITPYMVEPQDELTNPAFNSEIFVGPAQSGKTDSLLINNLVHSIMSDPMDMIMYCPTQAAARDFSARRIDRLHRHSDVIGSQLRSSRDADNKFDKHYSNGMMLSLSWPSSTEMAGKPIPRVMLTDYDRMAEDVDGEGSPFDLASKRTTTFGTFAMTVAESSPSRELENPRWISSTKHEAPPTTGILALYNRGDRRRWYWPCPHCDEYFEGEFSMLKWESRGDDMTSAETVAMVCPHCEKDIHPDHRKMMNRLGRWVKDGQHFDKSGRLVGKPFRSSIASFWLKGVAASFVTWKKLVEAYLVANREYEQTQSEEALKKFYNTDLAEIYFPKSQTIDRLPEDLKSRAESFPEREVPPGVRFLIATVDVQKNMFVVQVFGIMPGTPFDMVLVDRFDIRKSQRRDHMDDVEWVKPGTYEEDWHELIPHVINKEYPLSDGSGRMMSIKLTGCDSGGREGVTANAYSFFRYLRKNNMHLRFKLLKGDPTPKRPRTQETFPDSTKKDKFSVARGDVPVLLINSNLVKDMLNNRLDCVEPGKGMLRFPDWLDDRWYQEMCAERRTEKGWIAPYHTRNEAWDLSYYAIALLISKHIQIDRFDWEKPLGWYAEWDKNDLVRKPEQTNLIAQPTNPNYDIAKLAEMIA